MSVRAFGAAAGRRRMTRFVVAVLTIVLGSNAPAVALAEQSNSSVSQQQWDGLAGALPGARLRLTLTDGTKVDGRLVGRVQPDRVVLREVQSSRPLTVIGSFDDAGTFR